MNTDVETVEEHVKTRHFQDRGAPHAARTRQWCRRHLTLDLNGASATRAVIAVRARVQGPTTTARPTSVHTTTVRSASATCRAVALCFDVRWARRARSEWRGTRAGRRVAFYQRREAWPGASSAVGTVGSNAAPVRDLNGEVEDTTKVGECTAEEVEEEWKHEGWLEERVSSLRRWCELY